MSCFSVQHIYCALLCGSPVLFADPVSVDFGCSKKTKEPMVPLYLPWSMLPSGSIKLGAPVSRLCKIVALCKASAKLTTECDIIGAYLYCDGTASSQHRYIPCLLQVYVQICHLFFTCKQGRRAQRISPVYSRRQVLFAHSDQAAACSRYLVGHPDTSDVLLSVTYAS